MKLTESYKKRLTKLSGVILSEEVGVDKNPKTKALVRSMMFAETNPIVVNKCLEHEIFSTFFDEKEKLILQIQSGQIINYDGNLYFNNTPIQSLGGLKSVGGYLDLRYTKVQFLGNLETVGRNLYLFNTNIQSIGNLKSVGGYLNLSNTNIQSLENLKSVGDNLYLHNSKIQSLESLETVGGFLDLYNTPNLSWDSIPKHLWDKVKSKEGRPNN